MVDIVSILGVGELERKIKIPEIPPELSNEWGFFTGGAFEQRTTTYKGTVYGLYFDDLDIRGNVRLTRVDKWHDRDHNRYVRKKTFRHPFQGVDVVIPAEKNVWSLNVNSDNSYFVRDGVPARDGDKSYREALRSEGIRQGLILRDVLLENIFGPIDRQLMEFYNQVQAQLK